MNDDSASDRTTPVAVYRPVKTKGLPQRAKRRIGEPVVQVVIQIGNHILDPPLGFAVFADGESVLATPQDLEAWDQTFTVAKPTRRRHR